MYQYLTGKLVEKNPTSIVLDVAGIGYEVHTPLSTFQALPEVGAELKVLTHFLVREDAQLLFGFYTEEERHLFRLLISVSGIGPKLGLTILSGIGLEELKQAIVDGSLSTLTGISGIGRKTAERMVVELREKIVVEVGKAPSRMAHGVASAKAEDSVQALMELGYKKQVAQKAVEKAIKQEGANDLTVSDLIRASLRLL